MKIKHSKKLIILMILLLLILVFAVICTKAIISYFSFDNEAFPPIIDTFSPWYVTLNRVENIAHVRMIELKHNFAADTRSEYRFEVLEWLKGGTGEKELSAFSSKRSGKPWGTIEYSLNLHGFEYIKGNEYIICVDSDFGKYRMSDLLYCPLYDITKSKAGYRSIVSANQDSLPSNITNDDFVSFIKELCTYVGNIEVYYDLDSYYISETQLPIPDAPTSQTMIDALKNSSRIAHVKFIGTEHNFAHDKRSEYVFEVIEWLKGGNKDNFSLYSQKHPDYAWGEIEYYKGFTYEEGKEYLIAFNEDNEMPMLYLPLEDIIKAKYYDSSAYDYLVVSCGMSDNISVINFIRYIKMISNQ